ncbi:MAG: DUF2828 family protein [Clostridia bacterium]|nr:DUF2828 family protein [Clostridia bacterium]
MLNVLKFHTNLTRTENGAAAYRSTESHCLDLFASAGAMRNRDDEDLEMMFFRAYAEDPDLTMKLLFFIRDIRGGLGERRIFRTMLTSLTRTHPESVQKNLPYVAEYGRFDDLLPLLDTDCRNAVVAVIREVLEEDLKALENGGHVSLLGKWLPSVNTSSRETVRYARILARALGMNDAEYRKTCTKLRHTIGIIENNLRTGDYTFDYSAQPAKAMLKYRKAFLRNDEERYTDFMDAVQDGTAKLNTGTLYPYEIIAPFCEDCWDSTRLTEEEARVMDTTWNALPDYTCGENALCVIDGSGSMYGASYGTNISPASVAMSLGIYFAERNTGLFHNHFITFSERPQLVEIKGDDIVTKVKYCKSFDEVANTNLLSVFCLILDAAVKNNIPQEEMPSALYIISDMEFDYCMRDSDETVFEIAKAVFSEQGYELPSVVFWNVACRNSHQPVTMHESGAMLLSGASPKLFELAASGGVDAYDFMLKTLNSPRYEKISA